MHLISKTHCSAQNLGLGAQTADHWVRRYVRGGSAQKLDWLVVEEITQLDMALWADLEVPAAERLPAVAGRAGLLGRAARRWSTANSSATWPAGAGTSSQRTCAPTPASSNFVKWVGEEACPTLEQAKARLKELYPSKPGWPDTTLVISHSKRMAVNAAANRALAPAARAGDTSHPHRFGLPNNQWVYCAKTARRARVWLGLSLVEGLCGRGGSGAGQVRLDNGMRLKNQEHPAEHAVAYASCQGLTLHNRVRLDRSPATSRCATCTWAPHGLRLLEAA